MKNQINHIENLDSFFRAISFFCDDSNYVAMYGAIDLGHCNINSKEFLEKTLKKKLNSVTDLILFEESDWKESLKILFNKWFYLRLCSKNNKSINTNDHYESLCEYIFEMLSELGFYDDAASKFVELSGKEWKHEAQGIALQSSQGKSILLYFMSSD